MKNAFSKVGSFIKDKKLLIVGGAATTLAATNSFAAVTFDSASKTFTGDVDLAPYYSGVTVAIALIGTIMAVTLAIRAIKQH